jgi:protein-tyrosine-phosphatase
MAAKLLQHALHVENEPLNQLQTDSFGTSAFPGSPASENSIFVLSKVGLDLKDHLSKSADQIDPEDGLAFFCMTEAHMSHLVTFYEIDPARVFLLRQWMDTPLKEIPDPFGMGVKSYTYCRDSIVEAIPSVLEFLREFIGNQKIT